MKISTILICLGVVAFATHTGVKLHSELGREIISQCAQDNIVLKGPGTFERDTFCLYVEQACRYDAVCERKLTCTSNEKEARNLCSHGKFF